MDLSPKYECDLDTLRKQTPFINSTTLVYTYLRNNIVEHRIKPGQRLNQERVAIELNVSRTPVRDAFFILERENYLQKTQQGYKVFEMQGGDYLMLLDVRSIHETLAATLSCSRLQSSERKRIESNLSHMDQLLQQANNRAWDSDFNILNQGLADQVMDQLGELDHKFHNYIINASHNQYLIESYRKLDPKIHFFRHSAFSVSAAQNMKDRHRQIYEAIVCRDEVQAERFMKIHLQLTLNRAIRY